MYYSENVLFQYCFCKKMKQYGLIFMIEKARKIFDKDITFGALLTDL